MQDGKELSEQDARKLTEEVKADAQALWAKLLELYEGQAHKALGYSSWGDYWTEEFGGSKSRGFQMLEAGRVLKALEAHSTIVESPANEGVARELAGLGDEEKAAAWEEAVQKHGDKPTAKQVREVVQSRQRREQIFTQWMDVAGSTAKARLLVLKATKTVVETDWPEGPARPEIDASYMEMLQTVLKELKDSVALLDTALGGKPDVDWDAEFAKLAEAEDA
jgi:hypothetical protein